MSIDNHEQLAKRIEDGEYSHEFIKELHAAGVPVKWQCLEGSIDTVEKLRQELLPDSFIKVTQGTHPQTKEVLYKAEIALGFFQDHAFKSTDPTEAAARLACLVRALGKE